MENYTVSIVLGILSSLLIWLYRRSYTIQDKKLSDIAKQLGAFRKLLLFLKIQNMAQNQALDKEFKNDFTKVYNKELDRLMKQEDFQKVG